ncbi:MAG: RluA family pseudouridine synthase [Phycisphaerae bacterium]|nr:RluA family pseudouridine synthase [Phycisphaerae bacterium]
MATIGSDMAEILSRRDELGTLSQTDDTDWIAKGLYQRMAKEPGPMERGSDAEAWEDDDIVSSGDDGPSDASATRGDIDAAVDDPFADAGPLEASAAAEAGLDDDDVVERFRPAMTTDPRRARIVIARKLPGRRLDKYLHGRFRHISRSMIQRQIKRGEITVNGKPTKNSYEMEAGDVIDMAFPAPEPYEVTPENIPLDIVFEDEFIIAINKPAGMIVHPARREQRGTVANALAYYSSSLAKTDDPFRPGIVHRLDKNTTGIMIVAKTDEAHWRLSLQFERRETEKVYVAIVHGAPEFDEDVIDVPIGQHPTVHDRYIATGFAERMGGKFEKKLFKEAVTRYRVLERFAGFSLVELYPKTGRTHQLRIHMSHIRHPIVGDPFYGGRNISLRHATGRPTDSDELRWKRQLLHAHRLKVTHPITNKPLEVVAPLASDMRELLEALRQYARPSQPNFKTRKR